MDHEMARRDDATNRRAMAEYITGLDANSPDADIARRDAKNDERAMAEYIERLWLDDAEALQAEYRDEADTLATLRQF